jgi:hypothetical protein
MLPSCQLDHFTLSLPPQAVRVGSLCFGQVDLTISPCLYLLRMYVGPLCFSQVDLIISPCLYLLRTYVGVLYASVMLT